MVLDSYDALVIGGGPGGSACAALLARAGKRVLLLEKEHFPRFHIGESLLPYNHALFKEIGVLPALEASGFPIKLGAQFHLGHGAKSLKLVFRNGSFTRHTSAFQVERATFDHILLKHARASGADVREGWQACNVSQSGDRPIVHARDESGTSHSFSGSFVVDASGRANLTGNQEQLRVIHPHLKKLSVFGHFEQVSLDAGPEGGDTVIVRLENKWFWLIPLSKSKTSVGCVLDKEEFAASKQTPAEIFRNLCQSSAVMRERMQKAVLVGAIQTTSDFSYYNRRLVGPRLLRVGDAAGFMDPIFSSGVYLAMYSGTLAANAILQSLPPENLNRDSTCGPLSKQALPTARKRVRNPDFFLSCYEKEVFRAMKYYWEMVEGFYTQPFLELFMEPRAKFHLPDAVTAILAGELQGGWGMEWRRRLFFLLARAQALVPLVPRISFPKGTDSQSAP